MKTLRAVLAQAEHDSVAIRHFNVPRRGQGKYAHLLQGVEDRRNVLARLALSSDAWDGQMPFLAQNGFCAVQVGRFHEMWFDWERACKAREYGGAP